MKAFAIYRLPYSKQCTLIEQTSGTPHKLSTISELSGCSGFVVAPFKIDNSHPTLLIRPDKVTTMAVKEPSGILPEILSEKNHKDDYSIDFANFHSQLEQGTFQKIVLARSANVSINTCYDINSNDGIMQLFWKACQSYPRLFIALVALPDGSCWLTATPEILLEGIGTKWRTIALAGTMQLEGEELNGEGEDIRWSTKNIQEQRYVSTYIAKCLEQFSIPFTQEGPRTVRAANLVHLRSDFTFDMPANSNIGQLLQVLHPTPAVCGLPKKETYDFILQNEHSARQYYSGFMGPLHMTSASTDNSFETHLYVSLRCMKITGNDCTLYAGGGLLRDSVLDQEWHETEVKMQTMKALFK